VIDGLQKQCLRGAGLRPRDPALFSNHLGETTAASHLFGGHLRSRLRCGGCGHCRDKFEPFMDLSLTVKQGPAGKRGDAGGQGRQGRQGSGDSLAAALQRFTAAEVLDGDNQWFCPVCDKKVDATKALAVFRAPNVLCLQLKRFAFGSGGSGGGRRTTGTAGKIHTPLAFPEDLDLPVAGDDSGGGGGGGGVDGGPDTAGSSGGGGGGPPASSKAARKAARKAVRKAAAAAALSGERSASLLSSSSSSAAAAGSAPSLSAPSLSAPSLSAPSLSSSSLSSSAASLVRYVLSGVVVHWGGSVHSGHYYACVKGTNRAW